MCSFEAALPYVALAVFSAADWEKMLRDRMDSLLPGTSRNTEKKTD